MPLEPPKAPVVIALYSYNGGVGKSTAAYHLGMMLAASGRSTLLVDMDAEKPSLTLKANEIAESHASPMPERGIVDIIKEYVAAKNAGKNAPVIETSLHAKSLFNWPIPNDFCNAGEGGELYLLPVGNSRLDSYKASLDELAHELAKGQVGGNFSSNSAHDQRDLAREIRNEISGRGNYDYILLDCRAGINWESQMAARFMSDHVALFSGLDYAQIRGMLFIAEDLCKAWASEPAERGMGFLPNDKRITSVVSIYTGRDSGDKWPTESIPESQKHLRELFTGNASLPYEWHLARGIPLTTPQFTVDGRTEWESLHREYGALYNQIRKLNGDDFEALCELVKPSFRKGNFEAALHALRGIKGLTFNDLNNPYYHSFQDQLAFLLMMDLDELPDEKLSQANEIARFVLDNYNPSGSLADMFEKLRKRAEKLKNGD